ncbi:CAAD domain-containing protein [Pseudanabaena galeata UHCC 0370]|uniref:CAAD domain-containing protein n=1 Tax=Pseudanabaena galeata UHCC 0370 TaxID=3110310 RepID=A0ABU5THD5_9CYAN|nr:CAAD domain-containing protein [Pseudanabaena galeata]MEA5477662.1 CAAD domain-containing protein [Pseudanabaena galeata UHCC 0370]
MEPKENTVELIAEDPAETVEATSPDKESPEATETTKSVTSVSVATTEAKTVATQPIEDSLNVSFDILKQIKELWEEYFGESKKTNRTLAIAIIATIPVFIVTSELLGFLNKLPVLPSLFELVGFVYSVWFVYRYLLLANTRKELIDGITAWKNKVFG